MKKVMLLSLLVIVVVLFAGCGKDEPKPDEKQVKNSAKSKDNGIAKPKDDETAKAENEIETSKLAMPKDYKYEEPIGYASAEELGKAVTDARNNALEDEFKSFVQLMYIKDKENQWKMMEYMRISSLIAKEMMKQVKEKINREMPKAEFIEAEINGDSGKIHMNDKKAVAIIKVDGKWYVDFQKNFDQRIFSDFESALDYLQYQLEGLKKGMTPREIQKAAQLEAIWMDAKVIVATIRVAIEDYKAAYGEDISELDFSKGFIKDSFLVQKLRLTDSGIWSSQYFDAEDFSVSHFADGTTGNYIVRVDASKGKGGATGEGPKEGSGSYNSSANEYSGMLK